MESKQKRKSGKLANIKKPDASTSNENPDKENSFDYRSIFIRGLTLSGLIALLGTYANFFGYTYIKGKLNVAGFSANSIGSDVNENVFNAVLGMLHFLTVTVSFCRDNVMDVVKVLVVVLILFLIMKTLIKKNIIILKRYTNVFDQVASAYGIVVAFLIFLLLLLLGHGLGSNQMSRVIEKGEICSPITAENFNNKKIIRSCTHTKIDEGYNLNGIIVYEDPNYRYLLTNNGAYQINRDQKIVASNCFYKKGYLLIDHNYEVICSARCESICQSKAASTQKVGGAEP